MGYIGNSFYAFLARLGVYGTERRMCERMVQVALNGSLWFWRKFMEGRLNGIGGDWFGGASISSKRCRDCVVEKL